MSHLVASESSNTGEHMKLVVKNTFLQFEEVDLCQRRKNRRSTTEAVFLGNSDFGNSDAETDVGSASDAFSPRSPSKQSCVSEAGSPVQLELAKLCISGSEMNDGGRATECAFQGVVEDSLGIQGEELVQAIEINDKNTAFQTLPSPTSIQPTSVHCSDAPGSNAIFGLNEPSGAASPSRRRQWSDMNSVPTFEKEQDSTTVMLRNLPNDYIPIPSVISNRGRVNTTLSSITAASQSTASGRRLSWDVPPTPESAYVGGSTASCYSCGMPMATMPGMMPTQNGFTTMSSNLAASATPFVPSNLAPAAAPFAPNNTLSGGLYPMSPQFQMQSNESYTYTYVPMTTVAYDQQSISGALSASGSTDGARVDFGTLISTDIAATTAIPARILNTAPASGAGAVTTVMLRNIPLKYNREAMLADLDGRGFAYTYDFFYLPIDFHTGNNVGYAFINFIDEGTVHRFRETYDGLQLSADSAKICQISNAKAQGQWKNVEQYRNSSVMNMEDRYQPVVFENGVRVPFPPPTRSLKPVKPRVRGA